MTTGPFADAWEDYRRAGWHGTIPLPARKKSFPPHGYTGENGAWPSYADCLAWADGPEGTGNIALRLPHNVLGIDVDNYGDKPGAATLSAAEQHHGPLPATWRTGSRTDGISGIRLYRIPEGLHWPGELGPGTELIQHRHRYAIVWPSVHPEGRTYRWITPDGTTTTAVPDPDQLPALPDTWIQALTGGQEHADTPRNTYTSVQTRAWILERHGTADPPCARMQRAITTTLTEIRGPGSSHNAARDGALRAVRLAEQGHAGLAGALAAIHRDFTADVTAARRAGETRTPRQAETEWAALVTSAVNLVTATPSGDPVCDCYGQITGLIVAGKVPTRGAGTLTPPAPRPGPTPTQPTTPNPDPPQPAPNSTAQPDADPPPETRPRTSWWPRNLDATLAGVEEEPPPAILARADGAHLFYAGKINALLGESESGKTWLLLLAVKQALADGRQVTYLDFEDTPAGIIGRLRSLGVPDTHLAQFAYIGPDETLHAAASDDLREHLDATQSDLIALDGVNAAMTLLGLDLEKNKDATSFAQLLLKPLAASGACVVMNDHVPKSKEARGKGGIGAQAKRAMMDGCALTVEVVKPFGRGMTGELRIKVDKDRPGHVRAVCAEAKNVGKAVLVSNAETGMVEIVIHPPDSETSPADRERANHMMLMELVSAHLFENPPASETSKARIAKTIGRRAEEVRDAVDELVERGYVERYGDWKHRLTRQYSIADDMQTDVSDLPPSAPSHPVPRSRTGGGGGIGPPPSRAKAPPEGGLGPDGVPTGQPDAPKTVIENGHLINTQTGEILASAGPGDQL
jgi:Bifunctional DNA primase/polymerase, N-terminal/AAA domain